MPQIIKPYFHPYAQRFFRAIMNASNGIDLLPIEKKAINTLVLKLINSGFWDKFILLYPYVGGTAVSNSFNLVDTNAYRINWNGGVSHNYNGITGNGTNAYGDTQFNPAISALTLSSVSFGFYNRTPTASGQQVEMGCGLNGNGTSSLSLTLFWDNVRAGDSYYDSFNTSGTSRVLVTPSSNYTYLGLHVLSRTSNTLARMYANGTIIGSSVADNSANTIPSKNISVLRTNWNLAGGFSTKNHAFCYVSKGLTVSEVVSLTNIVQNFQTILGRAV